MAVQISIDGKTAPEAVPQSSSIRAFSCQCFRWLDRLASSSDQPTRLCYASTPSGDCQTIPTPELTTQHFRTVKSQLVSWQNEGLTIEGLLYLPPDAEHKKVPLILDIHGGPLGSWEDSYGEWTNFLIGPWLGDPSPQPAWVQRLRGQVCRSQ